MTYLTEDEFTNTFGFEAVTDFEILSKRAETIINLYTQNFYLYNAFETDYPVRQQAVKMAVAYQIAYMDASGIMTADDKQSMASVSIGRTSISYASSSGVNSGQQFNLCLDAENVLKSIGFSLIARVDYDR